MQEADWIPFWIAIISGGAAILSGFISYFASANAASKKLLAAEKRILRDYQLEFSVEAAIRLLLSNEKWELRSFSEIKKRLHGFENDNDIRMALIRAGAVSFEGKEKQEMWGLISRNSTKLT